MKTKSIQPTLLDPTEASPSRLECLKCDLFAHCRSPFMSAFVPPHWSGLVLCYGEAPGKEEDDSKRPFVGKAGKLLYELAAHVGLKPSDLALTNANRCRPINNAKPSLHQIRYCRPFAVHDVLSLRPKWVLVLGVNAAKSVLNGNVTMKKLRRRIFDGADFWGPDAKGIKVAFTFHPAATFYRSGKDTIDFRKLILEDLSMMSKFKGYISENENLGDISNTGNDNQYTSSTAFDLEWGPEYKLITIAKSQKGISEVSEDRELWRKWFQELSTSDQELVGHYVFQDLSVAALNGLPLSYGQISGEKLWDTLLCSRMVNENLGAYDLESAVTSFCPVAPWKLRSEKILKAMKIRDFWNMPMDIRTERCRLDAWATDILKTTLEPDLNPTITRFQHQLSATLRRVEMAGLKIDERRYNSLKDKLATEVAKRDRELRVVADQHTGDSETNFVPTNNDHFRDLLYNRLGVEAVRYTAKSHEPSVDDEALVLIYRDASQTVKEAILAKLRYQRAAKLYSTYIGESTEDSERGLAKHLSRGFYIFPSINTFGARTGRRSSSKPNIQNWPKRMRAMVVSRYPGGKICKGDEEKLEPRILAYVAGIEQWQEIFEKGKNFYIEVAKTLWKKDIEKDTPLYKLTKSTILGTNYGMEPPLFVTKLRTEQDIELSEEEGADILRKYHRLYPQLPKYFERQKEYLLKHQSAICYITDQVRHLPCPEGEKTKGFKHLWNQALNHPIQCPASYVTGAATIDLEQEILAHEDINLDQHFYNLVQWWGEEKVMSEINKKSLTFDEKFGIIELGSREIRYPVMEAEIHDELLIDTPSEDIPWVMEAITEVMRDPPTLRRMFPKSKGLKLGVETSQGYSWLGK